MITLDSDTQLPRDVRAPAGRRARAPAQPRRHRSGARSRWSRGTASCSRASASARSRHRAAGWRGCCRARPASTSTRAPSPIPTRICSAKAATPARASTTSMPSTPCSNSAFPENALLSHDLIEGIVARAALVSDIELIDDYPTHFSAYSRRKHRWMRGDWQILRWLMPRVPDGRGRTVENHFNVISRWKILDNLRRSLLEPATLLLLLAGWFVLRGGAGMWTALSVAMLLLPIYAGLAVSMLRAPWGRTGFLQWCEATPAHVRAAAPDGGADADLPAARRAAGARCDRALAVARVRHAAAAARMGDRRGDPQRRRAEARGRCVSRLVAGDGAALSSWRWRPSGPRRCRPRRRCWRCGCARVRLPPG